MRKFIFTTLAIGLLSGIGTEAKAMNNQTACDRAQLAAYNSAINNGIDHDTACDIAHDVYVACAQQR